MKQISAMCTYIQSADSTDDSGVKVTINWQLVYFLLIYPSLPGNRQQDDNLTYISHAKNIIICTATVMPPSKLAACAPTRLSLRPEQLRFAQLIQCDSSKSQVQPPSYGNSSSVNTQYHWAISD